MSQRRIKIKYHKTQGLHHDFCITHAGFLQTTARRINYLLVFVDVINQLDWNSPRKGQRGGLCPSIPDKIHGFQRKPFHKIHSCFRELVKLICKKRGYKTHFIVLENSQVNGDAEKSNQTIGKTWKETVTFKSPQIPEADPLQKLQPSLACLNQWLSGKGTPFRAGVLQATSDSSLKRPICK